MGILLVSGRFLARRPALALAPRCSRGSPDKRGRDEVMPDFSDQVIYASSSVFARAQLSFTVLGDSSSTDWDKAWSTFKKKGKKTLFSEFSPNKYVTWNPRRSEYPLSEEVDPIKRAERSNLMLWTSPRFTLVGAIIIVSALLIYTLVVPPK
ncbi:hypothetical protein TRIUR3_25880 [Triticum urartu]|uniref:Uncharacterized protein n=1 Tax=Triticum urartu TaxID=4572 RepID=M7YEJ0_TRIUA|nr:uncharacterized protein LOC125508550 isoform X1 [Triticum urartu]XP_048571444.1 uncharacterized protein LOC125552037 isoform X1 [Triticum urartu]EMS45121.1 hypothetical protein TRIUR3_25880 [Triticum urartu]